MVTLTINNTADGIIEDYRQSFGSRVNIHMNTENLMASMGYIQAYGVPQVSAQQSLDFAGSEHIMSFEMMATQGAFSPHVVAVDEEFDEALMESVAGAAGGFGGGGGGMMSGRGGLGGMMGGAGAQLAGDEPVTPTLRLYGNRFEEFENGQRELIEGSFPQHDGEAVISMELAQLNNLTIGDEIVLYSSMINADEGYVRNILRTLTVVGIYFDMTDPGPLADFIRASFTNRNNEILTTLNTVIKPMQHNETGITISATYFLHEPALLLYFEQEARSLGLHPLMMVTTNEAEYYAVIQPVMGLRDVTSTFMIIVLSLGAMVLVLLSTIAIRERKYEIGVLRAMGMKKSKVAMGMWVEMLAITAVCLVVGLGAGAIAAQPISDALLSAQLENIAPEAYETSNGQVMFGSFGGGGGRGIMAGMGGAGGANSPQAQPLSELDVSISGTTIMQIIGISSALATVASLVAILRVARFESMKILSERD